LIACSLGNVLPKIGAIEPCITASEKWNVFETQCIATWAYTSSPGWTKKKPTSECRQQFVFCKTDSHSHLHYRNYQRMNVGSPC